MNRVEWELYGKTNADEVVKKTTGSLDTIDKNAKKIGDSFSTSIGSIFLKFLGPMALLQAAISWVSTAIEESKQKTKDAMDLAVKGESMAVSAETSYLARQQQGEDDAKKEKELADEATRATTERYIRENNWKVTKKMGFMGFLRHGLQSYGGASKSEDVQQAVKELAAEEMKTKGVGNLTGVKATDFKGPEGFGNVVGVGANPVLEAVTQQLDVQREMLAQLEIANAAKVEPTDFTKVGENTGFKATPYGL